MSAMPHRIQDRRWLILVAGVSLVISICLSPAFWLSGIGVALLAFVLMANSKRTGQWSYVPWDPDRNSQLTAGERFTALSALILIAAPLIVVLFIAAWFWGVH